MTIEQLLGLPSEELAKLTDEEILKVFEPCLKFTMPKEVKHYEAKQSKETLRDQLLALKALLQDE